jgi:ribosomal protein L40E
MLEHDLAADSRQRSSRGIKCRLGGRIENIAETFYRESRLMKILPRDAVRIPITIFVTSDKRLSARHAITRLIALWTLTGILSNIRTDRRHNHDEGMFWREIKSLILACKGCGAEVSPGAKYCRVCGISRPSSLLRASIIRPSALGLLWLALLLLAYRLW